MSSYTSNSDPHRPPLPRVSAPEALASEVLPCDPSQSAAWGRFLRVFAGCALVLGLGMVAGLVALDPYGAGQPVAFGRKDASSKETPPARPPKLNPRLGGAGRALDPHFSGFIIGNSHSQLLDPVRLTTLSSSSFASLSMPGTASREQLAVIDWLASRRGASTRVPLSALVVVLDDWWCAARGPYQTDHPFPYWLYSNDPLSYLEGLLHWESLEAAGSKLGLLLKGSTASGTRQDGYMDFEGELATDPQAVAERLRGLQEAGNYSYSTLSDAPPPAAQALKESLSRLPDSTAVVLMMTPLYAPALPADGSPDAHRLAVCKASFAALAAERQHTAWLDFMTLTPETADPTMFWDTGHYRSAFARQIENVLAARLRLLLAESRPLDPPVR